MKKNVETHVKLILLILFSFKIIYIYDNEIFNVTFIEIMYRNI